MASAAQAMAASMRQGRSPANATAPGTNPDGQGASERSTGGAASEAGALAHTALPGKDGLKRGDWGRLPKKVAEDLSRGQGEQISPEYRRPIEAYYRAIGERAKKPLQ
jgi:hypothetical protein